MMVQSNKEKPTSENARKSVEKVWDALQFAWGGSEEGKRLAEHHLEYVDRYIAEQEQDTDA